MIGNIQLNWPEFPYKRNAKGKLKTYYKTYISNTIFKILKLKTIKRGFVFNVVNKFNTIKAYKKLKNIEKINKV